MLRIWQRQLPGPTIGAMHLSRGIGWTIAWSIFIGFMVYVAIYPILDKYPLSILKLGEPWNSLVDRYSEQPMRFVVSAFLIAYFMPESWIEWLRTRPLYQQSLVFLKYTLAPWIFAVLIVYVGFAVSSHLLFNVRDSFGSFCKHTSNDNGPVNAGNTGFVCADDKCEKTLTFDGSLTDSRSLCMPTGVFAERGKRYAINIERYPAEVKWTFWGQPSFLSGQPVANLEGWKQPLMWMMYPFRRALDRPWTSFIVRYGPTGTEESFLDRDPPPLDDDLVDPPGYRIEKIPKDKESLAEGWTAKRDGEIYLYLNKPMLGIWGIETLISRTLIPNTGTARVKIDAR